MTTRPSVPGLPHELGITLPTLYRFTDEGLTAAYRFGWVIRVKQADVDEFIERYAIAPGSISRLYPAVGSSSESASAGISGSES